MTSKSYVFISIFFLILSTCNCQSCSDDVITVKKYKFNIKPLKDLGTLETIVDNVFYSVSICGREKRLCGDEVCLKKGEFSGCLGDPTDNFCFGLSDPSTDKFDIMPDAKGLVIIHGNGDTYRDAACGDNKSKLRFEIMCNENITGTPDLNFKIPQCPTNDYAIYVKLEHMGGCTIGKINKTISVGSIMLIVLFVSMAVYLIAGIIVNTLRGKRGIEMIPNWTFWYAFPSLIKDGFKFMIGKRSESSYSTIE